MTKSIPPNSKWLVESVESPEPSVQLLTGKNWGRVQLGPGLSRFCHNEDDIQPNSKFVVDNAWQWLYIQLYTYILLLCCMYVYIITLGNPYVGKYNSLLFFCGQDWGFARNGMSDVLRRLISLRRRSVLWLWYIFGLLCSTSNVWKNLPESEPSADFMRVGLFLFFTVLASLECSCGITV